MQGSSPGGGRSRSLAYVERILVYDARLWFVPERHAPTHRSAVRPVAGRVVIDRTGDPVMGAELVVRAVCGRKVGRHEELRERFEDASVQPRFRQDEPRVVV